MALSALAAVGWASVLIALDFMVVVSILVSALKKKEQTQWARSRQLRFPRLLR